MKFITWLLAVIILAPASANAQYTSALAVSPAVEGAAIAVEIPTDGSSALAGLRWFHNDGTQVFPSVVIVEGESGSPPDLTNPGLILDEVSGVSAGWGQMNLETAVTSSTGTAFAVFFLPADEPTTGLGEGGGPGIGIRQLEGENAPFWISSDALNWGRFSSSYELGVEPIYASLRGAVATISEVGEKIELPQERVPAEASIQYTTAFSAPTPNPFNPRVQLSFTLASQTQVGLKVYDVRGRLVTTLVSEVRDAGPHAVMWDGNDHEGRRVASGVYFARFTAAGVAEVRRMVLVR